MKRIVTYLVLIIFFATPAYSQNNSTLNFKPKKKWKAAQISMGLGVNWNRFQSMSHDELMVFAKDREQLSRDLQNMTEEATAFTASGVFNVSVSLSPLSKTNGTYRNDRELQFGVAFNSAHEAMVSFKNESLDTSIVFCNIQKELSFETAYLFKGKWGKRWHWYVGGGLNAGFTYGNQMVLMSGEYFEPGAHPSEQVIDDTSIKTYEAKSVAYSRVYIPYGLHFEISKGVLMGIDIRKGIGVQMIGGEDFNFMKKSGGFALSTKLQF